MIPPNKDGIELSLSNLINMSSVGKQLSYRLSEGWRAGSHLSNRKGRGMDFAEVRPYISGDDVRNIDWRITARTGKPHTKQFREERDRSVYILLDLSKDMYFGSKGQLKSRLATLIAAAVSWQTLDNGDKVGGLVIGPDKSIIQTPKGHRKSILQWLKHILECYRSGLTIPYANHDIELSLKSVLNIARPGSRIVVISDFYRTSSRAFLLLRHLRKRHDLNLIQIYDGLERRIDGFGKLKIENLQQDGYLLDNDDFKKHYEKVASYRQHELERKLVVHAREFTMFNASIELTEQIR